MNQITQNCLIPFYSNWYPTLWFIFTARAWKRGVWSILICSSKPVENVKTVCGRILAFIVCAQARYERSLPDCRPSNASWPIAPPGGHFIKNAARPREILGNFMEESCLFYSRDALPSRVCVAGTYGYAGRPGILKKECSVFRWEFGSWRGAWIAERWWQALD